MATLNNSSVTLIPRGSIRPNVIGVGGAAKGGVSNYELLTNKPSINGHELIGNKTNADLGIPTDTQDLTNTAGFITNLVNDLVNYYTKLEIDDIVSQLRNASFRIVDDLPLVGDAGVIYLILNSTPQSRNYYDEFIYIDNRWEKIGTTEIDLSGYVTDEELTQVLRNYITNEVLNETLRNYYNKADVNELLAAKVNSADLAAVATSGSYNDLTDKPAIPDELADLSDDATHRLVTDEEKTLWTNKSSFSGDYNDLINKPTLGTASSYDVPESGNAGTSQVVKGDDSRLSDARTPLSHTHSKADITDFPTNISAFNNDSGFITNTVNNLANYYLKTQIYTQTEVDNLISAAVNGRFQKVNELPASGELNVIYLVPKTTPEVSNACDEYIWQDGAWELIGSTEIDLSDYVTDSDLTTALQNYLTTSAFNTAIANYYTKTEIGNLLDNKVDKVAGKGLSTNDYDNTAKDIVDGVTSALNDKVDKVQGKGLSTNDYDNAAKDTVDGVTSALAGKANTSEMSITDGTGTDADKTTIQLKSGTSATVLKSHQDISGKADKVSNTTEGNFAALDANGNLTDSGIATSDVEEMQNELSTDTTTIEGNPINFSTLSVQNAKSTIIDLEPIQDLHGYDHPWVGGASVNLAGITNTAFSTTGLSITPEYDADGNFIDLKIIADGTKTTESFYWVTDHDPGVWTPFLNKTLKAYTWGMTTGLQFEIGYKVNDGDILAYGCRYANIDADGTQTITFGSSYYTLGYRIRVAANAVVNTTLRMMIVESSATVTSFSPYTNFSSISGRTQIGIEGCGQNLFDKDKISSENGYLDANGNFVSHQNWKVTEFMPVEGNNVSYNGLVTPGDSPKACWYDKYQNFISSFSQSSEVTTLQIPSNAKYLRMSIKPAEEMNRLMVYYNGGSNYEPYTESNDLTISFGQTVYGGQLDVENGVLVVDRGGVSISSGIQLYGNYGDENAPLFYWDLGSNSIAGYARSDNPSQNKPISSCYTVTTGGSVTSMRDFQFRTNDAPNANKFYFRDSRFTTETEFNTWVANNPIDIAYRLYSPITINLTPHTINLLKGVNNISTDGDKITLTYRDGSVATLGDLTSAVDSLDGKIEDSKILTDTVTGNKYRLVVTNGTLSIEQISN